MRIRVCLVDYRYASATIAAKHEHLAGLSVAQLLGFLKLQHQV